jgi:hypothetical protein
MATLTNAGAVEDAYIGSDGTVITNYHVFIYHGKRTDGDILTNLRLGVYVP